MTTSKIANYSIYFQWITCKISSTLIIKFDINLTQFFQLICSQASVKSVVQLNNVNLVKMFSYKNSSISNWTEPSKSKYLSRGSQQMPNCSTIQIESGLSPISKTNIKIWIVNWTVLQLLRIQSRMSKQILNCRTRQIKIWLNTNRVGEISQCK